MKYCILIPCILLTFNSWAQVGVNIPAATVHPGDALQFEIQVDELSGLEVYSFSFELHYDPTVISLNAFASQDTLSQNLSIVESLGSGVVRISAAGTQPLAGTGTLLRLQGQALQIGFTELSFASWVFNEGEPTAALQRSHVRVLDEADPELFALGFGNTQATVNETFELNLQLTHPGQPGVNSVSGTIQYDPAVMQLEQIVLAPELQGQWVLSFNQISSGSVQFALAGADPINQNQDLFTLQGRGIAVGQTAVTLTESVLNEAILPDSVIAGRVSVVDNTQPIGSLSLSTTQATTGQQFQIPVELTIVDYTMYSLQGLINYDPEVIRLHDLNIEGTLVEGWVISFSENEPGVLAFSMAGVTPLQQGGTLVIFEGTALAVGFSALNFSQVQVDEDLRQMSLEDGEVQVLDNQAPTALIRSPEGDITVHVEDDVTFAGFATDADGHLPLTWHWDFGEAAEPRNDQSPFQMNFNQAGMVEVTLTVTDALGLSTESEVRRIRIVAGTPPSSTILEPERSVIAVTPGTAVQFSGYGTDHETPMALSYHWQFGNIGTSNQMIPDPVTFFERGEHRVVLQVTDSDGMVDDEPAECTVIVTERETPYPIIENPTQDLTINVGTMLAFQGGVPEGQSENMNYRWDFGGLGPGSSEASPEPILCQSVGTYEVSLHMRNEDGTSSVAPAVRMITVVTEPPRPEARIQFPTEDLVIQPGDGVLFRGIGAGLGELSYRWRFGGDMPDITAQNPGVVAFNIPGIYTVELSVRDSSGTHSQSNPIRTVTVEGNQPPQGEILSPQYDVVIVAGESVTFEADAIDPDGSWPLRVIWSIDEIAWTAEGTRLEPVHFDEPGNYQVLLEVIDSEGGRDPSPATRWIRVVETEPRAFITSPASDLQIAEGELVEFHADYSASDEQHPLSFSWKIDGQVVTTTNTLERLPLQFDPGRYEVSLSVEDRFGLVQSVPPRRVIEAIDCSWVKLPGSVAQGLQPARLNVEIACPDYWTNWHWQLEDDEASAFGHRLNTVDLPERLTYSSWLSLVMRDLEGQTREYQVTILVPYDQRFEDFDGDGRNTSEDLIEAASHWRSRDLDANGDAVLNIIDLLYIHIEE